jgi:hypothetical protein
VVVQADVGVATNQTDALVIPTHRAAAGQHAA